MLELKNIIVIECELIMVLIWEPGVQQTSRLVAGDIPLFSLMVLFNG